VTARFILFALASAAVLPAASPDWLTAVAPILKPVEKKAYLAMSPPERARFESEFWSGKSITAGAYFQRVQYIDATFGSGKTGSGANTDPGRVYLSIGPPTRIRRIPSSRIFVPLEIWYYDVVPGLLNTELRLIFYQKNGIGFPKLYSPELDTIRVLLLPQASVMDTFGPNDTLTEATLRNTLNVPPAEDEIITAAVNVATGIKNSGNGEIIGEVLSPGAMLTRDLRASVDSKLIAAPPSRIDFVLSKSAFAAAQVDIALSVTAQHEIGLEVLEGSVSIYRNNLALKLGSAQPLQYLHRLDLLAGSYRIAVRVDGKTLYHSLEIPAVLQTVNIILASEAPASADRETPFEFEGTHLFPDSDGAYAILPLAEPGGVAWTIRRGIEIVWRQRSTQMGGGAAVLALPLNTLAAGKYELEAVVNGETRSTELEIGKAADDKRLLISFNANLSTASRNAFSGHQWLLRGDTKEALHYLQAAPLKEALVDLARIDALTNHWDQARERLRPILAADPHNFDALCVYAYVETSLQDYAVAADYYRRALAVQDSPAIRLALAQLPQ
jgi:GWxTD domain-containing protein